MPASFQEEARLTRFLRAFEENQCHSSDVDLFYKAIKLLEETNKLKYNWATLREDMILRYGPRSTLCKKMVQLECLTSNYLREFRKSALQELRIEQTALLLLRAFLITNALPEGYCRFFEERFGEASLGMLHLIRKIVEEIRQLLPTAQYEKLRSLESSRVYWGSGKEYSMPQMWVPPDTDFPEFETPSIVDNFSMTYCPGPPPAQPDSLSAGSKQWLSKHMEKYFYEDNYLGMTKKDLQKSIVYILSKPISSNELQNELYSYLGHDKFDFVRDILLNRKTILQNNQRKIIPAKDETDIQHVVSVSVTTQEELDNEKKRRKEEKKRNKIIGKRVTCKDDSSSEDEDFNPSMLRMKRIAELTETANSWFTQQRNDK